jgi:carboxymethylenebutenolidase
MEIKTEDGQSFDAYAAMPDGDSKAPAIVVLQEIFGVNHEMKRVTDKFAALGYVAVCPDLWFRMEPHIELTDKTKAEWDKAFDYMKRFDVDQGIKDVQSCISAVRSHERCNGKVGAIGFCLGGKLAYLTASRTDIDASVGYYGVALDELLGEAKSISCPLMLHFAELDQFSSPDARKKVYETLKDKSGTELHLYREVDHAFARQGGDNYDASAAETANERSAVFLDRNLGHAN